VPITFGNHDAEGLYKREALAGIVKGGKYSVLKDGPAGVTGVSNYIYNIENPDGGYYWSLFIFDSNMYIEEGEYDYIHEDQIDWYKYSVASLKEQNGGNLNSLAFFHIPLQEYGDAWEKRNEEGNKLWYGEKREDTAPSDVNSGLFQVFKEVGSTKGVFCGHEHVNDYSVTYQGIRLTYGLKTGYGSYGEDWLQGGTVITLSENDFTVEEVFCN
jgi:hypothetical protein